MSSYDSSLNLLLYFMHVPMDKYQNLTRWLKYFAVHWHGLDTDAYQNKNDTIYIA